MSINMAPNLDIINEPSLQEELTHIPGCFELTGTFVEKYIPDDLSYEEIICAANVFYAKCVGYESASFDQCF